MSFWRRLKNLWILSGITLDYKAKTPGDSVIALFKRSKMAKVVEADPLDTIEI